MADLIAVEVAHATPEKQKIITLEVVQGTTVMEAVEQSGISSYFPDIQVDEKMLGIFSRKVKPEQVLKAGDRVEIYRPLIADPKEVRRQRAAAQKEKG